jgi:hypothetical protein
MAPEVWSRKGDPQGVARIGFPEGRFCERGTARVVPRGWSSEGVPRCWSHEGGAPSVVHRESSPGGGPGGVCPARLFPQGDSRMGVPARVLAQVWFRKAGPASVVCKGFAPGVSTRGCPQWVLRKGDPAKFVPRG